MDIGQVPNRCKYPAPTPVSLEPWESSQLTFYVLCADRCRLHVVSGHRIQYRAPSDPEQSQVRAHEHSLQSCRLIFPACPFLESLYDRRPQISSCKLQLLRGCLQTHERCHSARATHAYPARGYGRKHPRVSDAATACPKSRMFLAESCCGWLQGCFDIKGRRESQRSI